MQKDRRIVTWAGAISGVFLALLLNAALAHGADKGDFVTEEFHQTYPLAANGRVDLSNINGSVHITAWDQNQVKVDAIKRADDADGLKRMEIRVDAHPDTLAIETKYHQDDDGWNRHGNHMSEVEYTLTVPRNARLDEIKLINGGLDVTGVNGEVRASCINGKLVAQTPGGRQRAVAQHVPAARAAHGICEGRDDAADRHEGGGAKGSSHGFTSRSFISPYPAGTGCEHLRSGARATRVGRRGGLPGRVGAPRGNRRECLARIDGDGADRAVGDFVPLFCHYIADQLHDTFIVWPCAAGHALAASLGFQILS